MSASVPSGSAPLLLRKLAIRRLAGLGDAGFTLDPLSPGINVIFGPNGVGKSRTAWAINLALWPAELAREQRDAIDASFDIGEESWSVQIDGDVVRHQRGGMDAAGAPSLAAVSERDRYNLALGELLADHGDAFAGAIARESAGGYDLLSAATAVGIARRPSPRWGPQTVAVQEATRAVRECEGRVAGLRERESTQAALLRDRDAARAAVAQAAPLRAALDLVDAVARQQQADALLASFPPILASMSGQELEQLGQLRIDRDQLADAAGITARQRHDAVTAIAQTRLDDSAIDAAAAVPASLGEAGRRLAELGNRIVVQQQSIESSKARQERARLALGADADEPQLGRVEPKQLAELAAATREAEVAELHHRALAEQHQALAEPAGEIDPAAQASRLETGLFLLTSWLSEPEPAAAAPPRRDHTAMVLAVACIILLAALLAWRVHWALAFLGLLGLAVYGLWRGRAGPVAASAAALRPALQSQYAAVSLPVPQWSRDAVRGAARALSEQLAATQLRRSRAQRRSELEAPLAAARGQWESAAARRAALAGALGMPVPGDSASLHALAEALGAWRAAEGEGRAAAAALGPLEAERASVLAAAAGTLLRFGYTIAQPHEVEAAREALRGRLDQHRSGRERLATLEGQAPDQARRAAEIQRRIEGLFAGIGLGGEADEPALRQYASQRGDYESARRGAAVAAARTAELGATADALLAARPRVELAAELEAAGAAAAVERELSDKIIAIQTQVDAAKKGHELEAAEAARREAAAALAEARQQSCDAAAGWALVEHLRRSNRDRNRPAVLRAAAGIFARITRGRYRLEFDDRPAGEAGAGFVAVDVDTGIGQPLWQLSAGTRVQLLLAVRVAFVEQQERGPRLPLLLDEALANSDEVRARQVVDAVVEISRSGRQVFYFTAQVDEVEKWREILQRQGAAEPVVPFRLIDLAEVRGWASAQRTPLRELVGAARPVVASPEAAGMDRAAYGRLLAVPGIDPRAPIPGGVHLWHLIDELPLLHRMLSRGVNTWGQLETMQQHGDGGDGALAEDAGPLRRAAARAKLLAALARLWRIGRGRPVDRAALAEAESGVSEVQLPRVLSVAESVGWDAQRLLQQLESRAVASFQTRKLEALKQYLAEQGYTDPRPPLDAASLQLAAMGAVQHQLDAGLLTAAEVEQFQRTWFG